MEGCIALAQNDVAGAQKLFEPARAIHRERSPGDHRIVPIVTPISVWPMHHGARGRCDPRRTTRGRAKAEIKRRIRWRDHEFPSRHLSMSRVGKNDLAIPLLERLLKMPGAVDSADYSITLNDLRKRWEWDSIRNDPRFQEADYRDSLGEDPLCHHTICSRA